MTTKPTGTLKQFLETTKKPTRMVGPIERYLLTRPADTSRRTDIIHPSALAKKDFCVRESFYVIKGYPRLAPTEKVNLRLESIFAEGHSIHHKWQGWLADMGVLYGVWTTDDRLNGDMRQWGVSGELSHAYAWHYAEVPLYDENLMIAGHADGWVKGLGDDFLIEIKSVGTGTVRMEYPELFTENDNDWDKVWKDIRRPFPTHLRQGQLYLELARRTYGDEAPKEIVFLYENKANQAYKEFVIGANPNVVKPLLAKADQVVTAVRNDAAPACSIDIDAGCQKCRAYEEAK